ncbi:Hemin-binding lipoprotein [Salinivirga cyanobacteriivorans]|uniref:Hemin-binding lipoprotein n=1 Tax=Salinivirga cyanobacteriivorans TaxID=1307839 RepID=A0A0S2HYX0_9BACT|nr:ABC transporter substrate-binding protein [Salinivirga cyanobacteriivorans]ALO15274.1 Hemin-binding lipoprotein [Salinivirga cyanobacteriivorans]
MRGKFYILIISALTLLFTMGCKLHKTDESKVFRYNESKGIGSLDPAYARSQTIIWPVHQIFDGLVQFDSLLNIKPAIAKKWKISEDGLFYTFTLRKDVEFHKHKLFKKPDSRRVNAHDFVYSFNRIMDPATSSPGAWVFSYLDKKYGKNGCKAPNDSTLQIKLKKPFPPFIGLLGMKYCAVVPEEIISHYGNAFGQHPIGTGPFMMHKWKQGDVILLKSNPDYYEKDKNGRRLPYIESVVISFITDKQSEFMEFMLGNLDFISGINAQYKDALLTRDGQLREKHKDKIYLQTGHYLNTEYFGFNLDSTTGQVVPKAVRQAINYCFDREEMVTYLRNNMAYPAHNGMVPPALTRNYPQKVKGYHYNPDLARRILDEAGFHDGYNQPIQLLTTSDYIDICEYIQHKASRIGINIEINLGTGASYRNMISKGKVPMFRASWIADYPDAENYLALFYSKNKSPQGPNYTRFGDSVADRYYKASLKPANQQKRDKFYYKMEKRVISFSPVVPLYYDKVVRFVQNDIQGLPVNPFNLLELKHIKKTEKKD